MVLFTISVYLFYNPQNMKALKIKIGKSYWQVSCIEFHQDLINGLLYTCKSKVKAILITG
jgi:hypothetical protein